VSAARDAYTTMASKNLLLCLQVALLLVAVSAAPVKSVITASEVPESTMDIADMPMDGDEAPYLPFLERAGIALEDTPDPATAPHPMESELIDPVERTPQPIMATRERMPTEEGLEEGKAFNLVIPSMVERQSANGSGDGLPAFDPRAPFSKPEEDVESTAAVRTASAETKPGEESIRSAVVSKTGDQVPLSNKLTPGADAPATTLG